MRAGSGFCPPYELPGADDDARTGRLALRAEAGAVLAKDTARIPNTLMFPDRG